MSYCIDVNLLLYASDANCLQHERAARFLATCVEREEAFCLAWLTLMSYLRMATHPRIFAAPLSPAQAVQNVRALIDLPQVRVLSEGDGFWKAYREISADVPTRGNLVPDVHLAAVLRTHGIRVLYTHDRDFRKIPFIEARDPLA